MCDAECITFFATNLSKDDITGKRVLDVGALSVNGSVRPFIEHLQPAEYVGIDLDEGPAVDKVMNAEDLVKEFGENSFDLVVTTELLEHVEKWQVVISQMKRVLKPGGKLVITTRSKGKEYHAWPYDFWRYEVSDMANIFADMEVLKNEPDPIEPGVFVLTRKPKDFQEKDLSDYELYSIILDRKAKQATWETGRGIL